MATVTPPPTSEVFPTGVSRPSLLSTSIQTAIQNAVAKIPEGHTSALVAHVDGDGASVSVIVNAGDHWAVHAAAVKPWYGPLEYGADVIYSW